MAGGNHHGKPSSHPHHNKPSSSSSSHRKSRWEDRKPSGDPSKPPSKPSPNQTHKSSNKPNPSTLRNSSKTSLPLPSPAHPKLPHDPSGSSVPPIPHPPPFPDLPTYGFHMLDRRNIVLADGTVRSYFALPPDYLDFAPPMDQLPGRFFPGPELGMSPGGMRPDMFGRHRNHEHWNSGGEGSLKRKFGGEEGKDEILRKRQQVLNYGNANSSSSNMYSLGGNSNVNGSGGFSREEELKPSSKYMRMGGAGGYNPSLSHQSGGGGEVMGTKHGSVNQDALKKAFLRFVKLMNENPTKRKRYMEEGREGSLQCLVCGRSSKDYPDMHGLVMHTYHSDNTNLLVDHLGLHKALCVLMGWNYSKPPDNSKAYKSLSASEAAANQDDLIMWPPLVIIHNTSTGKGREGRMEGLGNKTMDAKLRDLGFRGGKSKSLYSREGHLGITLIKFASDQSGLKEAMRLADYFEKEKCGRRDWARVQSMGSSKDDESNPNLVKVDEKTKEKSRIFYGYLGTAADQDKVDFEIKKKVTIESIKEKMRLK